jgi:hypothetical protein
MIKLNVRERTYRGNGICEALSDLLYNSPYSNVPVELRVGDRALRLMPTRYDMRPTYRNYDYCLPEYNFDMEFQCVGDIRVVKPDPKIAELEQSLKLVEAQRDANAARVKDLEARFEK